MTREVVKKQMPKSNILEVTEETEMVSTKSLHVNIFVLQTETLRNKIK